MSADHDVFIRHDIDTDSLMRIVEDALDLDHFSREDFTSEGWPFLIRRSAPGLILTTHANSPMGSEIIGEWLGFQPKVSVGFRWDKEGDWPTTYHRILRATSAVLTAVPDDVALVLNGETGELIRRSGRVILTNDRRRFTPGDLAEIRVPYEFGRVPGAEDAPGP